MMMCQRRPLPSPDIGLRSSTRSKLPRTPKSASGLRGWFGFGALRAWHLQTVLAVGTCEVERTDFICLLNEAKHCSHRPAS